MTIIYDNDYNDDNDDNDDNGDNDDIVDPFVPDMMSFNGHVCIR